MQGKKGHLLFCLLLVCNSLDFRGRARGESWWKSARLLEISSVFIQKTVSSITRSRICFIEEKISHFHYIIKLILVFTNYLQQKGILLVSFWPTKNLIPKPIWEIDPNNVQLILPIYLYQAFCILNSIDCQILESVYILINLSFAGKCIHYFHRLVRLKTIEILLLNACECNLKKAEQYSRKTASLWQISNAKIQTQNSQEKGKTLYSNGQRSKLAMVKAIGQN